jgi:hypothetical protein
MQQQKMWRIALWWCFSHKHSQNMPTFTWTMELSLTSLDVRVLIPSHLFAAATKPKSIKLSRILGALWWWLSHKHSQNMPTFTWTMELSLTSLDVWAFPTWNLFYFLRNANGYSSQFLLSIFSRSQNTRMLACNLHFSTLIFVTRNVFKHVSVARSGRSISGCICVLCRIPISSGLWEVHKRSVKRCYESGFRL